MNVLSVLNPRFCIKRYKNSVLWLNVCNEKNMKHTQIKFQADLGRFDRDTDSLLICCQPNELSKIDFNNKIKEFISDNINFQIIKDIYYTAIDTYQDRHIFLTGDSYYPYLLDRESGLYILPPHASRHNAPNRPISLTKILTSKNFFRLKYKTCLEIKDENNAPVPPENVITPMGVVTISKDTSNVPKMANLALSRLHLLIACPRPHMISYGVAIARAYPAYCVKTSECETPYINLSTVEVDGVTMATTTHERRVSAIELKKPFQDKETTNDKNKASDDFARQIIVHYQFTDDNEDSPSSLTKDECYLLEHLSYGVRLAAILVDMPCNILSTNEFIQEIERIGKDLGITAKVIRGTELQARGFGGIYGVGKAAVNPPALVVLSYAPSADTENSSGINEQKILNIAWVGKGIVYDTGGLSLKGKTAMPGMKRDCGGAAAILGAFYTTIKMGFRHNLHAVFCLAENAIGPNATRPDDIHTLYSGKTVEINNTDAEGRLVLADGVAYASTDLECDIIVDMATLTGAQGIATGKYHGAVITNNGDWETFACQAGRISGDLVFPLPYCPELHMSEFSSTFADMKNSVANRDNAQSSCAALFIASHLVQDFNFPGVWMHIDMASPVHNGERATGYGVGLLTTLFGFGSNNTHLQSVSPVKALTRGDGQNYFPIFPTERTIINRNELGNVVSTRSGHEDPFGLIGKMMKTCNTNHSNYPTPKTLTEEQSPKISNSVSRAHTPRDNVGNVVFFLGGPGETQDAKNSEASNQSKNHTTNFETLTISSARCSSHLNKEDKLENSPPILANSLSDNSIKNSALKKSIISPRRNRLSFNNENKNGAKMEQLPLIKGGY